MSDKLVTILLSVLVLGPVAGIGGAIAGSQSQYPSWAKAQEDYKLSVQRWHKACKKANIEYTCKLQELKETADKFNRSYKK
jgi:hypothetical protein